MFNVMKIYENIKLNSFAWVCCFDMGELTFSLGLENIDIFFFASNEPVLVTYDMIFQIHGECLLLT